ncbi:hypothetical protein SUDANB15_00450 [Streptomyces sp. enrichment culture]
MIELDGCLEDTRISMRRERPHPGTQLSLFDPDEDLRHQALLTDTSCGGGSLQHLAAHHRAHRVQDRIRRRRLRCLRGTDDDRTHASGTVRPPRLVAVSYPEPCAAERRHRG